MKPLSCLLLLGVLLSAPGFRPAARAVSTDQANYDTFADFNPGEFDNVSLGNDGRLQLAPALTNLASINDPIIWCAVRDREGNVFFGTGNHGKVYKLTPKGELSVFFAPNEVMVHALAIDRKGRLYAATSPDGRVYRLDARGHAEVFCSPGETYIWDMTFGKDGALYLATGNHGKILRVPEDRSTPVKAETYFDTEETHITALAWDRDGNLLAGTSPHGYLYRIDKAHHGFVLFNSGDTEIKQIAVSPQGAIYVSTFVENPQHKSSLSIGAASVAVRSPGAPTPKPASVSSSAAKEAAGAGGKLGAIYRVDSNGFYERYWSAPDEAIYSMARLHDGRLLVGTGDKGRIYSVSSPIRWRLLQKTSDGAQVSALLPDTADAQQFYAATSHPGRLEQLDFTLATNGTYTSKAFDAKQKSQWGTLRPDGDAPAGTELEFSARSGNTEKPEKTWSDWSTPVPLAPQIILSNPPARYLQYRVEFRREAKSARTTAVLRRVRLFYQNQNAAPAISRIKVYTEGFGVIRVIPPPTEPPVSLQQLLSGNVPRTNPAALRRSALKMTKSPGMCTVAWKADDPNGDDLDYSLAIRAEGEKDWTLLVAKTQDDFFSFDTTGYHEGLYRVRVTASDAPANTPATARTTEETSEAFLIDNTPPKLTLQKRQLEKGRAHFTVEAVDGASVISSASYSLDGKDEVALRPVDLMFDSTSETFALQLSNLSKGAHSLLLRVQDEANNAAVLKLNFDLP